MLVAINRQFKNKPASADFGRLNRTFENVELSLAELAAEIQQGHVFCAQHKNGNRKSANFTGSGLLAVDVDHGLTTQKALEHPFVQQFGGFLYTTVSHSQEEHRFRVVFELEAPITDRTRMEQALSGLILKLGGDAACKDACRMFFGNTSTTVTMIGKTLPNSEVDRLITRVAEVASSHDVVSSPAQPRATIRSQLVLDRDVMVTDRQGKSHRLVSLPVRTAVRCPMHVDDNPSAFTIRSRKGTPGVHCKTCNATFFIQHEGPFYDFDYHLNRLRGQNLEELDDIPADGDPLLGLDVQRLHTGVSFIEERYLASVNTAADVVLIRSPKGSGKTEWLKYIVEEAKKQRRSVLLIGHRQNLIITTAKRLGLMPYIQMREDPETTRSVLASVDPTPHYAVCVDSLSKLLDATKRPYDIVIIDEVEQVTAHLTAETLRDRRRDALVYLQFYLRKAKKIYCLDADLNSVSVAAMADVLGADRQRTALLVANEWTEKRGSVQLYRSDKHLAQVLREHLASGRRCFVCSNSKALVTELKLSLQDLLGAEKRFFLITSDESKSVEAQEFLNSLPESMLQYDCVLVSPAVGTGVDITFADGESKVDSVFGFFRSRVTTHFDIDQQLCRVRRPSEVHVWIEPATFSFETDRDVLREEYLQAMHRDLGVIGLTDDGTPEYPQIDKIYASIYAEVKALQRASKNNLVQNFRELRLATGWDIVTVEPQEDSKELGEEILERGKELAHEAFVKLVCEAPAISSDEYSTLRAREEAERLFPVEVAAMRRYELEHFYFLPASEELIELDAKRKFRDAVKMFEALTSSEKDVRFEGFREDARRNPQFAIDRDESIQRRRLLVDLFSAAGVFKEAEGFNCRCVVTQEALGAFAQVCRDKRVSIERLLDKTVRGDLEQKAAQQLGEMLRLVGLSLKKLKTVKKGDKKLYSYQVDNAKLVVVEGVVKHRRSLSSKPLAVTETVGSGASPSQLQQLIAAAVANAKEEQDNKARKNKAKQPVLFDGPDTGRGGDSVVSTSAIDHRLESVTID